MCIAFALLLTVILFGMARVVIKMTFGKLSEEKLEIIEKQKQNNGFYVYSAGYNAYNHIYIGSLYSKRFK